MSAATLPVLLYTFTVCTGIILPLPPPFLMRHTVYSFIIVNDRRAKIPHYCVLV